VRTAEFGLFTRWPRRRALLAGWPGHGYDVLADLQPGCRYDEVVRVLGGAGELVTRPAGIGPALRRAFAADAPYLVNVVTDPETACPRSTAGP
jgi:acetolactate synthase I/II/III large subunit